MKLLPLFVLLVAAQCISCAATITFDEFGSAPLIDANGFSTQGVTFAFVPGQAVYNDTVGTASNVLLSVDPVLSGPTTGVLTLTFDYPTSLLNFDILLLSISTIDDSNLGLNGGPAYTVLLSNGLSVNGGTTPLIVSGYSEGEFTYSGDPVTGATISFFTGMDVSGLPITEFGVDNLAFVAPEPGSFLGLVAGLVAIGMMKRRQLGGSQKG